MRYALSLDNQIFWTYQAGLWAPVDAIGSTAMPASALTPAALLAFGREVGPPRGKLYVRAMLTPAGGQGCSLAQLVLSGHG